MGLGLWILLLGYADDGVAVEGNDAAVDCVAVDGDDGDSCSIERKSAVDDKIL